MATFKNTFSKVSCAIMWVLWHCLAGTIDNCKLKCTKEHVLEAGSEYWLVWVFGPLMMFTNDCWRPFDQSTSNLHNTFEHWITFNSTFIQNGNNAITCSRVDDKNCTGWGCLSRLAKWKGLMEYERWTRSLLPVLTRHRSPHTEQPSIGWKLLCCYRALYSITRWYLLLLLRWSL